MEFLTPLVHDPAIDGLRGLAAIAVFYGHVRLFPLDPGWSPWPALQNLQTGQAAVLIFFVLSGYVIGSTNTAHWSSGRAGGYLQRRAMRLLPINAMAVGLAFLVGGWAGMRAVVGNLNLAPNDLGYFGLMVPTLSANPSLWTPNYEVECYGCFLGAWKWSPRIDALIVGLVYTGRPILCAALATDLAWTAEYHIQPWIKQRILSPNRLPRVSTEANT